MEISLIFHGQTRPQFNLVKGNYLFKVLKELNCSQRHLQLPATEATAPCRACFTPEKVPFFHKAIIFLLGDTTQRDALQHNAARFSKNWPF